MGSMIPCLGIFALPLAITGLTWSGIGWLNAASRKHANTSPFIVGGIINLLAICIVVGMCYWIFSSGRNARDETADSAAATIIAEAATEDEDIQSKMARALHTGEWFRCSNGLQVRVLQGSNEEATGNKKAEKDPENNKANDPSTPAPVFSVKIALRNRGNKTIRYRDFLPTIDDSSDQGIARLFDEDGSSYSLVLKPEHTHPLFVLNGSPAYPAKSESSINPSKDYRHIFPLFFEPIPDDLKKVYLELPLKNLGVSGSAIFEIDTSSGRRP